MYPNLFGLPFLHSYGLMIALGVMASLWFLKRICRRTGRSYDDVVNLVMLMLLAGLVGARTWHVVEFWDGEFAGRPFSDVFKLWSGGLVFHGGLLAACLVLPVWCCVKRASFLETADLLATILPLAHGFGRVGCFLFGCCYGIHLADDAPLAWLQVTFPAHAGAAGAGGLPVLPAQLFEAGALFLFFVALYRLYRRCAQTRPGLVAGVYLLGSAVIRFAVEFLRDDPRSMFGALSIGQVTSVALALCALPFLLRRSGGARGSRSS